MAERKSKTLVSDMQKESIFLLVCLFPILLFGQPEDTNYIFWNKNRHLQVSDFQIKVGNVSGTYSFGQLGFECNLGS